MSNSAGRDGGVQSVDRAITVVEILARRGEAGVSEVAAEIDVHRSTAFQLLGARARRAGGRPGQVPARLRPNTPAVDRDLAAWRSRT
ncbi:helix-turn-helix domain-containing protein [Pseudonocardia hydrocarbonoxydans]|uniref:helix-turn-helix domain-containing protein n=1 Tax=Pseudonocardia hydrocarbonoxydans TaxID=76726 RepID=UPI003519DA3B